MARVNEIRFVGYGVSNLEMEKIFYKPQEQFTIFQLKK